MDYTSSIVTEKYEYVYNGYDFLLVFEVFAIYEED